MTNVSDKNNTFSEALNYSGSIYRAAHYLTGNPAEAEDLVQDVYLKACANWNKFKAGTNCKAWLFRILHNTRINQLIREAKKPEAMTPEQIESFPAAATASAVELRQAVEEMVSDEIKAAVKKLPTEYIEPIILAWVGDFSYAEISEMLECPVGTVMSRLHRARVLLRNALKPVRNDIT
ncbi:MAG: sigma-70 family RNA polymerase sigma factor [Planctomycetota bacterium]